MLSQILRLFAFALAALLLLLCLSAATAEAQTSTSTTTGETTTLEFQYFVLFIYFFRNSRSHGHGRDGAGQGGRGDRGVLRKVTVPPPQHDFFICLFFVLIFQPIFCPFFWLDKVFSEFTSRLQAFSHARFLSLATKICNVFQSLLLTKKCSNPTINSCFSFFLLSTTVLS